MEDLRLSFQLSKYKSGLLKPTDEGFSDGAIGGIDGNTGDEAGDSASNSTSAAAGGGVGGEPASNGKKVNGALDPEVLVLRKQIEKSASDVGNAHRTMSDLRHKNAENEERMITLNKELHSGQELIKRLQIELNENVAQKEDQVGATSLALIQFNSIFHAYHTVFLRKPNPRPPVAGYL